MSEIHNEDDPFYTEPYSLAEHQQLIHSARNILKKSRRFFANKKPKVHLKKVTKTPVKKLPVVKPRFDIVEQGKKLVLVPREAGKPTKIIQLPPKAVPDMLTIRRVPLHPPSKAIPSTSIQEPSTSTESAPKTTYTLKTRDFKPINMDKFKAVNLTIGNKKIVINPQSIRKIPNPNILKKPKEPKIEDLPDYSQDLNPENFPKAIVYPEVPKEKPPMLIKSVESKSPFTFNMAFEESTQQQTEKRKAYPIPLKPSQVASRISTPPQKVTTPLQVKAIDGEQKSPASPQMQGSPREKEMSSNDSVKSGTKSPASFVNLVSTSRPQSRSSASSSPASFFEDYDDSDDDSDQFMAIEDDSFDSSSKDSSTPVGKTLKLIPIGTSNAKEESRLRFMEKLKKAQEDRSRLMSRREEMVKSLSVPPNTVPKTPLNPNLPIRICVPRHIQEVRTQVKPPVIPPPKKPQPVVIPIKNYITPTPPIKPHQPIVIDDDDDEEEDEEQFEAVKNDSPPIEVLDEEDFVMPIRPEANANLFDMLASYRVIARYLMLKKNIQPFNFDSTGSEYISMYRTMKK